MPNNSTASVAAILDASHSNDVAISPDGTQIYIAGNDGYLNLYNALTGELEHAWHVGTQLGGIDISPDGTFLIATELTPLGGSYSDNWPTDTTDTTVYKVDLSTGAVTSFPVTVTADEYVFNDVAVLSNGTVLLSEQELPGWSGWVPAWTLDLGTGAYTKIPGGRMSDFVSATNDGSHALFGENDISDASLTMYGTTGIVATHSLYADNVEGFNSGVQAISGEGNLVAQYVPYNGLHIYDLGLHYEQNLAVRFSQFSTDTLAGLAFDSTGHNLYVLDATANTITQISTADWSLVQTISVGADVQADGSRFADALLISPDSHYFTILTGKSVLEVGNPASPYTIIGTAGDDHLTGTIFGTVINGGNGADTLIGGPAVDILSGGAGADTLTGGGGNDLFRDTAAGLNGDTITDFGGRDAIVFSDATVGNFTYSLSGNVLTYTGGSLTLSAVPDGPLFMSVAAGGGVQLALQSRADPHDFNGDGYSDIILRNDGGQVTDWLGWSNGALVDNSAVFSVNPGTDWHVEGLGDFNGDGYGDVLWRNDSGAVVTFLGAPNGSFVGNVNFNLNPGTDWHVEGTGDFNGDGRDDILWRNDAGAVVTLLGNANGSFTGNVNFNLNPGLDWHVEGTGDFNGDGRDDILWRNDAGAVVTLLGNENGSFTGNVNFNLNPGLDWHIEGTGDFNGDGRDDILWRNDAGQVVDLLGDENGSFTGNVNFNLNPGLDWHIVQTGDFNGDGYGDILWQSDSGTLTDLLGQPNGAFIGNVGNFTASLTSDWHVEPEHALV